MCSGLSKGEDVVVCLPGARIEHVTERVEKIIGRGGSVLVHIGTNNADNIWRNYSDSEDIQEPTDEACKGWEDHLIGNVASVWKQEPRIQTFEEDDSQRDGAAAV